MLCMTSADLARYTGRSFDEVEAEGWIRAGQQIAESYTNRRFCYGEYTEQYALGNDCTVLLHAYPIDAEQPVTMKLNGTVLSECWTMYGNGVFEVSGVCSSGTLEVTYTGGYTSETMPEPIKIACALIVRALRNAQQNDGQQVISEKTDEYSVTYAQVAGGGLDKLAPAAAALLRPYISKAW